MTIGYKHVINITIGRIALAEEEVNKAQPATKKYDTLGKNPNHTP